MCDTFAKDGEMFNTYKKIYAFHKAHNAAFSDKDWMACVNELGQFTTPFEVDMAVAVVSEIERQYKEKLGTEGG